MHCLLKGSFEQGMRRISSHRRSQNLPLRSCVPWAPSRVPPTASSSPRSALPPRGAHVFSCSHSAASLPRSLRLAVVKPVAAALGPISQDPPSAPSSPRNVLPAASQGKRRVQEGILQFLLLSSQLLGPLAWPSPQRSCHVSQLCGEVLDPRKISVPQS